MTMGIPGLFSGPADPDGVVGAGVFSPFAVGTLIAFSAPTALDFTGKAGGINTPVCQCAKLTAARFLGYREVYLTVNKENARAVHAYEKYGMKREKSIKTDIGGGFFMDDYVYVAAAE